MPTRNVNLTPQLDSFVTSRIENGRYENASEVIRAALRRLEREEKEYDAKFAALLQALDDGDASGIAEGDVFRRIKQSRRSRNRKAVRVG
jgi:antitoxin ParD1/3/4